MMRFFSFEGRTPRLRLLAFWATALGLGWIGIRALDVGFFATYVVVGAIAGVVSAKLAVESVRRLHDSGHSGWRGLFVAAGVPVLLIATLFMSMGDGSFLIPLAAVAIIAIVFAATLLRSATPGPNAYGEPCPGELRSSLLPDARSTRGIVLAAALASAGAATGYGLISWSEGMRQVHEDNARHARDYQPPTDDPLADEYNAQQTLPRPGDEAQKDNRR